MLQLLATDIYKRCGQNSVRHGVYDYLKGVIFLKRMIIRTCLSLVSLFLLAPTVDGHAFATSKKFHFGDHVDYATNQERNWVYYKGYIQFRPAHKLKINGKIKHVKRGEFRYKRGRTVVSFRATRVAPKRNDKKYYVSGTAWDSFNWHAPKTEFHYNWKFF